MNIAPISEPNTMIPAQRRDPEVGRRADLQVVERVRGPPLTDEEQRQRRRPRRANSTSTSVPSFGTGAKLIAEDQRADQHDERMPPRLSTGSVASFTWAGTRRRHHERDHGERQREQEHRAPPEVLEQEPRAQRAERGDRAAETPTRARSTASAPGPTTAR